ncbi:MAG: SDR family oxidoreductase [Phyllobacteriaceae bacterium]|nr:SDR family oxidoreductase [Phyllobacteriaceae bacterium]
MSAKKVAIVTGAGTGVGRAAALHLARNGWGVVFAGRRKALLDEAVAEAGGGLATACDVTSEREVERMFAETVEAFGRVDLLFNNAGASAPAKPIDELAVEEWSRVVAVNLHGAFLCARAAFGQMRRQRPQGGRIINNGSISAHAPRPGSVAYTTTKHAISGLTKTLALDGRPFDIACGQIDIGNALTPMTEKFGEGLRQANGDIAPEPTMDAQAVGDAVLYRASLPLDANVLSMTVMATKMPFVGRG